MLLKDERGLSEILRGDPLIYRIIFRVYRVSVEDSKPLTCSWVCDDFRDLTARKTNFPEGVFARDAVDRRLV